jgi:hypothetical protein
MWRHLPDVRSLLLTADPAGSPTDARRRQPPRVKPRTRQKIIRALRRAAARAATPPPPGRFRVVLLHDRLAPVREELLDLAARLERATDPDPEAVNALWRLLTDGCGSPLYNRSIHPSELAATLYYAKQRLGVDSSACDDAVPTPTLPTRPPGSSPLSGRALLHARPPRD